MMNNALLLLSCILLDSAKCEDLSAVPSLLPSTALIPTMAPVRFKPRPPPASPRPTSPPIQCPLCSEGQSVLYPETSPPNTPLTCGSIQDSFFSQLVDSGVIDCFSDDHFKLQMDCSCGIPAADAPCTSICLDGNPPPQPFQTAFSGLDTSSGGQVVVTTTCGDLESLASLGILSSNACASAQYLGATVCGCGSLNDTRWEPPPCELCDGGVFPPNPLVQLGVNTEDSSCNEFFGSILNESNEATCATYRNFAADYCGCPPSSLTADACRICGGKTLLPAPLRMLNGTSCGEWELLANENPSECTALQESHQDYCCAIIVPELDSESPSETPVSVASESPSVESPNYPTTYGVQPPAGAPFFFAPIECKSLCSDGQAVPFPDLIAFVDVDTGLEITCEALDDILSGEQPILDIDCEVALYIGSRICGCNDAPRPAMCELCEDGSGPPNPAALLEDGVTCVEIAVSVQDEMDEVYCKNIQASVGVYCGCQNPLASQNVCRLCGNDTILPQPDFHPVPERSCGSIEFDALQTPELCANFQSVWGDECCQFPPTMTPSIKATPQIAGLSTNNPTASSGEVPSHFILHLATLLLAAMLLP